MHVPPFKHGDDPHSFTSVSHASPVNPAAHTHRNTFALLSCQHVAPFRHGDDSHSFRSVSQITPKNPSAHAHRHRSGDAP